MNKIKENLLSKPNFNSEKMFANYNIKSTKVICIDQDNKNLGVLNTTEAIKLAYNAGLDLVQVATGNPPTAKIADLSKMKFEASKKAKEQKKKQREAIVKEHQIKFRPTTDDNDLKFKAKKADEFVEDGDQVKVIISFKGREVSHTSVAMDTFNRFMDFCSSAKIANKPLMSSDNYGKACLTALLIKK